MAYSEPKKESRWFWKIEFGGSKKQETKESKEKVLALNSGEIKQNKSKFFKGTYNKRGKYGQRASDLWGNEKREAKKE